LTTINLFSKVLPLHKILIKPNETANRIYIPGVPRATDKNVESGETVPLVTSSDSLNCCWLFRKCAGMDEKVIRQTVLVLEKKEKERKETAAKETQMHEMENMLEEIRKDLKFLKNK
jgi:hypothetical protein